MHSFECRDRHLDNQTPRQTLVAHSQTQQAKDFGKHETKAEPEVSFPEYRAGATDAIELFWFWINRNALVNMKYPIKEYD